MHQRPTLPSAINIADNGFGNIQEVPYPIKVMAQQTKSIFRKWEISAKDAFFLAWFPIFARAIEKPKASNCEPVCAEE